MLLGPFHFDERLPERNHSFMIAEENMGFIVTTSVIMDPFQRGHSLRLGRHKLTSAVNDVLNNIMSTVSNPITAAFIYWLSVRVILCNTSVRCWSLALVRAELH